MQKEGCGGLKILEIWKGGGEPENNHVYFTPENLIYMILCGVYTYFPLEKREGGGLKFFELKFIFISPHPYKCLLTVPKYTMQLGFFGCGSL